MAEVEVNAFPAAPAAASGAARSRPAGWMPLEERRGVLCYALVRTPPEPTVELLSRQMAAACDGWALFGHAANESLGIIGAYSASQERHGWLHFQEDMTLQGAWRHFAQTGQLWKYAWLVKFDTDSYVRPSRLRRSLLLLHDHAKPSTVSSGAVDGGGTSVEGWFVATPAALVDKIYQFHADGACDPGGLLEQVSGHVGQEFVEDQALPDCTDLLGLDASDIFLDAHGHLLTAQPQRPPAPERCSDVARLVLEHFSGGASGGPLCGCKAGAAVEEVCVSEDVAIVHPVKDADAYRALAAALP